MNPQTRAGPRSSADAVEVEWQFDAADLAAVERWLRKRSGGGLPEGRTKDLHDTYLDTADWRFLRSGHVLRVRERGGAFEATIKSLEVGALQGEASGTRAPGPRRRLELTQPLPSSNPATLLEETGPVSDRVRAVAGIEPLIPRGVVRTTRTDFSLAAGKPRRAIATVSVDRTTLGEDGASGSSTLNRVEVELEPGATIEEVDAFVERLRTDCELVESTGSKFERALAAASPDVDLARLRARPTPPPLPDRPSLGDLVRATIGKQLQAFEANEPIARMGEDPEGVHDMRVATRRLRAALDLAREAFATDISPVRDELRWLAGTLGAVRDLDVLIDGLEVWSGQSEETQDLEPVRALLEERRDAARASMVAALDSERWATLRRDLAALTEVESLGEGAAVSAASAAVDPLASAARRFQRRATRLTLDDEDTEWHQARIRGKRLRYAIELFEPAVGRSAAETLAQLKRLQDVLGEIQDAAVAREVVRGIAAEPALPRAAAFALGEWAGWRAGQAEGLKASLSELLPRYLQRWRRLERRLQRLAADE